ncbi:MAG: hypothetical protein GXO35_07270 [Gammaproteobacteria bacterium]|nr:hypothetical protein [Gammaproteobacteria bacterium]
MFFSVENIKVRLHPVEFYQVGSHGYGFIHVQCRMHSGKTSAQKQQITTALLKALETMLMPAMVLTIEVVDMATDSYAKKVQKA